MKKEDSRIKGKGVSEYMHVTIVSLLGPYETKVILASLALEGVSDKKGYLNYRRQMKAEFSPADIESLKFFFKKKYYEMKGYIKYLQVKVLDIDKKHLPEYSKILLDTLCADFKTAEIARIIWNDPKKTNIAWKRRTGFTPCADWEIGNLQVFMTNYFFALYEIRSFFLNELESEKEKEEIEYWFMEENGIEILT